jgi:hypothetical protein
MKQERFTGGIMPTEDNWSTRRKTSPIAAVFTTDPLWTDPGSSSGLRIKLCYYRYKMNLHDVSVTPESEKDLSFHLRYNVSNPTWINLWAFYHAINCIAYGVLKHTMTIFQICTHLSWFSIPFDK